MESETVIFLTVALNELNAPRIPKVLFSNLEFKRVIFAASTYKRTLL